MEAYLDAWNPCTIPFYHAESTVLCVSLYTYMDTLKKNYDLTYTREETDLSSRYISY